MSDSRRRRERQVPATPNVSPLVWDDELERLALEVSDLFGDTVLFDAMRRALHVAAVRREAAAGDPRASRDGVLESSLRDELHRLLRPH
jgi:hypothetical protein